MFGLKKKVQPAPKIDVRAEMMRRKSHYRQILELFKKEGEVTNADLAKITARYSARIGELRKDYTILAQYEKPGVWRYTFLGEKNDD